MTPSVLVLAIGCFVVVWIKRSRARRQPNPDPRRALSSIAAILARGSAAGMTPADCLCSVADRLEGPVREDLETLRDSLARGVAVDSALESWVERARHRTSRWTPGRPQYPDVRDVELLVGAIRFGEPRGAGLIEAFEGVATALTDRAELDHELCALTSQAWASVVVLCSLPLVGVMMMAVVARQVISVLFGTRLGIGCLVLAVLLDGSAVLLARHLTAAVRK